MYNPYAGANETFTNRFIFIFIIIKSFLSNFNMASTFTDFLPFFSEIARRSPKF